MSFFMQILPTAKLYAFFLCCCCPFACARTDNFFASMGQKCFLSSHAVFLLYFSVISQKWNLKCNMKVYWNFVFTCPCSFQLQFSLVKILSKPACFSSLLHYLTVHFIKLLVYMTQISMGNNKVDSEVIQNEF